MVAGMQTGAAPTGEGHLIDRLIERLSLDWPEFERSDVSQTVRAHLANFRGATVRDYLPVLVERAAGDDLRHRSHAAGPIGHGPLWTREDLSA